VGRDTWASHTLPELDSYAESTRHVTAETGDGLREPEEFKLWRMEVMRQAVDVAHDVFGPFGQTGNGLGERWRHRPCKRAEATDLDAQQRKFLA
jgi:hypothetical protein